MSKKKSIIGLIDGPMFKIEDLVNIEVSSNGKLTSFEGAGEELLVKSSRILFVHSVDIEEQTPETIH